MLRGVWVARPDGGGWNRPGGGRRRHRGRPRWETERLSTILLRTHIGDGFLKKAADSLEVYGSRLLGVDEVERAKKGLEMAGGALLPHPEWCSCRLPRQAVERGKQAEATLDEAFAAYASDDPEPARADEQAVRGDVPVGWDADILVFDADGSWM